MLEKPRVLVSKCLGFCKCRYDGAVLPSKFVEALKPYVDFVQVCPEVEIGLGVPRDFVRLVLVDDKLELYQPKNDRFVTDEMNEYSHRVLSEINDVEGAILKGRSPTCGIKDVKIYHGTKKGTGSSKGVGIFADHVYSYFPTAAIEEEGRLTNLRIREHFLVKLFTNMRFKNIEDLQMKDLVDFHAKHKFLLMTYSQKELKNLGNIVANHKNLPYKEVLALYKHHLGLALLNPPTTKNITNTLMHLLGYFSKDLIREEKEFLLENLEKIKDEKMHIGVPVGLIKSYAIKYKQDYILDQYIWKPFPDGLLDIKDSGS